MKLEFLSFDFDKFAQEMQNLKDKKGFEERCGRVSSKVRSLPIFVKAATSASTAPADHTSDLAFLMRN